MLAKALARSLDCSFSRLQFTPDLLPSDVTGVNVFNQQHERVRVPARPGLRATSCSSTRSTAPRRRRRRRCSSACRRTRSRSTASRYALEPPFMVIATQNPIEYEGTYPLPEAQLDRFTMRVALGYPPLAEEARMLTEQTSDAAARLAAPGRDGRARCCGSIAAAARGLRRGEPQPLRRRPAAARRAPTSGSTSAPARAPGSRCCAWRRRARSPTAATIVVARRREGGRRARARAPPDPRARGARGRLDAAPSSCATRSSTRRFRYDHRAGPARARPRRPRSTSRAWALRLEAALPGRRRARSLAVVAALVWVRLAAPAGPRAPPPAAARDALEGDDVQVRLEVELRAAAYRRRPSSCTSGSGQARRARRRPFAGTPAGGYVLAGLPRGRYALRAGDRA